MGVRVLEVDMDIRGQMDMAENRHRPLEAQNDKMIEETFKKTAMFKKMVWDMNDR